MQPWIIPIFCGALFALVLLAAHFLGRRLFFNRSKSYRKNYLELVQKLERITIGLNRMTGLLTAATHRTLLDLYETNLKQLEDLLTLINKLPPFGNQLAPVMSAHFLVNDLEARLARLEKALKADLTGRKVWSGGKPHASVVNKVPIGCYFCSRPFIYSGFSKVKARIEGKNEQVYSCDICKEELAKNRRVKILYFVREGKPLHWSQVPEYNPVRDFWDLQRKNVLMKTAKLELIYSRDQSE